MARKRRTTAETAQVEETVVPATEETITPEVKEEAAPAVAEKASAPKKTTIKSEEPPKEDFDAGAKKVAENAQSKVAQQIQSRLDPENPQVNLKNIAPNTAMIEKEAKRIAEENKVEWNPGTAAALRLAARRRFTP